jgi:hypothetical protein
MKASVLAFVALGAVLIGVLVFLTLQSSAPSLPLSQGPDGPAENHGPDAFHLGRSSAEASADAIISAPSTEPTRAQLSSRMTVSPRTIVLYGYVRTADGTPLPTEPASINVVDATGKAVQAAASAEGAYSISGLLPGRYHVTASAQPNATAEASVDLVLAETPKRYDVALVAKSSLLVRVVDRAGQPLKKAWLGAVATREAPGEWVEETPNEDLFGLGRFRSRELEGSTIQEGCLGRLDLESAPPVFVSLLHNQRVIATQRVEAGQQEVSFVIDADSKLLAKGTIRIRFLDQAGAEVPKLWATLTSGSSTRMANPKSGAFVWPGLEPGWYRIQVYAQGFEQPKFECRIEPG